MKLIKIIDKHLPTKVIERLSLSQDFLSEMYAYDKDNPYTRGFFKDIIQLIRSYVDISNIFHFHIKDVGEFEESDIQIKERAHRFCMTAKSLLVKMAILVEILNETNDAGSFNKDPLSARQNATRAVFNDIIKKFAELQKQVELEYGEFLVRRYANEMVDKPN